jgi:hypothetical protein
MAVRLLISMSITAARRRRSDPLPDERTIDPTTIDAGFQTGVYIPINGPAPRW